MNDLDASHYEVLRGRIRGVLISVAKGLSLATASFVDELLDANECGEALEVLTDALTDSKVPVPRAVIQDITDLYTAMGLSADPATCLTSFD